MTYGEGWTDCLNEIRAALKQAAENGSLEMIGLDTEIAKSVETLMEKAYDRGMDAASWHYSEYDY